MSLLRRGRKPYRIVLENLPLDVRVVIEAAMDDAEVLVVEGGRDVGRLSIAPVALEGPVVLPDIDREPAPVTPVPEGGTVVATAMRLSRRARARLSEELGEDFIVMDLNEAPDSADVLLIPAVSPTLIGMLRSRFTRARVLVTEIEAEELGTHYAGPVSRILDAGATAYLPPRSISGIAAGIQTYLAAAAGPAITAGEPVNRMLITPPPEAPED